MKASEVNDEAKKIVGQVWVKTNPAGDVISWAYTAEDLSAKVGIKPSSIRKSVYRQKKGTIAESVYKKMTIKEFESYLSEQESVSDLTEYCDKCSAKINPRRMYVMMLHERLHDHEPEKIKLCKECYKSLKGWIAKW